MEFRQLRYLLAVARTGSFSRGATTLHMTQPPLSAAIAQLETDLGTRLLDRSSRGTTVTETGSEVVRYAERVMMLETELRRRIAAIESGLAGTLELAVAPVLTAEFLPDILIALSRGDGGLDIALHEADPMTIIDSLRSGLVDAGIVATVSGEHLRTLYRDELLVESLYHSPTVAVLPPTFRDAPDPIALSEIAHLEFAIPARSMMNGLRTSLADVFDAHRLTPPRIREVPSMQEAIPLISAGLTLALMPESVRQLIHPERACLRRLVDGPPPLEVSMLVRRTQAGHPVVRRFRETALRLTEPARHRPDLESVFPDQTLAVDPLGDQPGVEHRVDHAL